MASVLAVLPTVFSVASTIVGAVSSISQGRAFQEAAVAQTQASQEAARAQLEAGQRQQALRQAQAAEMEQRAGQQRAVAQRRAIEERRQGELVQSRARAIAAASGGGALDPSVIGILGDVDREVEVRALNAMFEGEEAARGLEFGAALERVGGAGELAAAQRAARATELRGAQEAALSRGRATTSFLQAGGTLLEGGSSLFSKYAERQAGFG